MPARGLSAAKTWVLARGYSGRVPTLVIPRSWATLSGGGRPLPAVGPRAVHEEEGRA